MKIAIMQPYIFPYIGYFQLINAVDKFVFYDDVNYIKGGWINRNRIVVNGKENIFTIPLNDASSFRTIEETEINQKLYPKWERKFLMTIQQTYHKAPFYKDTYDLIYSIFSQKQSSISELAISSIKAVSNYLEISTVFDKSSTTYSYTKGINKADRIIKICDLNNVITYINPIGGEELYQKDYFKENGVDLLFMKNKISSYPQFDNSFISGLSIIDVLMFNSKEEIKEMCTQYTLI
jgi:hypothetical protein